MRLSVRAALAAVWCLGLAATASAAPVPAGVDEKKLRQLFADLGGDGKNRLRAALALAATPKETVAFLAKTLKPLHANDKQVDQWIADVQAEEKDRWEPAMEKLKAASALPTVQTKLWHAIRAGPTGEPMRRLILTTVEPYRLWNEENRNGGVDWRELPAECVSVELGKQNFQVITTNQAHPKIPGATVYMLRLQLPNGDCQQGDHFPPWFRDIAALEILEHINTPEAVAVIRAFADGHPDAPPTKAAREALERLAKKGP